MNNSVNKGSSMDPQNFSQKLSISEISFSDNIIFIHMNPNVINLIDADFSLISVFLSNLCCGIKAVIRNEFSSAVFIQMVF